MSLQREQTIYKLFFGHLKTEDGNGLLLTERHMLGNVQYKRCLSHRRTRRHQDQIRTLQTGEFVIQINEACRNSGYRSFCLRRFFYHFQRI